MELEPGHRPRLGDGSHGSESRDAERPAQSHRGAQAPNPAAPPRSRNPTPSPIRFSVWSWQDVSQIVNSSRPAVPAGPAHRELAPRSARHCQLRCNCRRPAGRADPSRGPVKGGWGDATIGRWRASWWSTSDSGARRGRRRVVAGYFVAPLVANPGAGLIGNVARPRRERGQCGFVVACWPSSSPRWRWIPSIRAAPMSTTAALADSARSPEAPAAPTAWAAHLPVPMLLGLRWPPCRPTSAARLDVRQRRSDDDHDRGSDVGSRGPERAWRQSVSPGQFPFRTIPIRPTPMRSCMLSLSCSFCWP